MRPTSQFAALADETRCRLLELLHERPRPVHELASAFAISRPAISRHLKVLKDAGLVREEKRGRENLYTFDVTQIALLTRWLTRFGSSGRPAPKAIHRYGAPAPDLFDLPARYLGLLGLYPPLAPGPDDDYRPEHGTEQQDQRP